MCRDVQGGGGPGITKKPNFKWGQIPDPNFKWGQIPNPNFKWPFMPLIPVYPTYLVFHRCFIRIPISTGVKSQISISNEWNPKLPYTPLCVAVLSSISSKYYWKVQSVLGRRSDSCPLPMGMSIIFCFQCYSLQDKRPAEDRSLIWYHDLLAHITISGLSSVIYC